MIVTTNTKNESIFVFVLRTKQERTDEESQIYEESTQARESSHEIALMCGMFLGTLKKVLQFY